jgi:hypothetical protein
MDTVFLDVFSLSLFSHVLSGQMKGEAFIHKFYCVCRVNIVLPHSLQGVETPRGKMP